MMPVPTPEDPSLQLLSAIVERLERIEGELRLARHERIDDMVDQDEACRLLGVSYRTLRRMVLRGDISIISDGRQNSKKQYSRKSLNAYARANSRKLA